MHWPAQQLAAQAPDWLILNVDAAAVERFSWGEAADLLVIFQTTDVDLLPIMKRRRERGLKTIVEYNDNFYDPPPSSPAFSHWRSSVLHSTYENFMRAADGVMTTSSALVELFAEKTARPCHRIRNNLPFQPQPLETLLSKKSRNFSIAWAGSIGHAADLIAVTPTLRRFLADHESAVLRVMGNEALPEVLQIPKDQFIFQIWGDMNSYFAFLTEAHVGVVPLIKTPYNECRSDVKAIEMVGSGVLPLLPRAEPYTDFTSATGVPTWESFEELMELLVRYSSDTEYRERDLARCLEYVRGERIGAADTARKALYESYLPQSSQQQSIQWPNSNGFMRVKGTPSIGSMIDDRERSIRAKLQRGEIPSAISGIRQFLEDYDGDAGAALRCLKLLHEYRLSEEAIELCFNCKTRYPNDKRFSIVSVEFASDGADLIHRWNVLLDDLASWSALESNTWSTNVVDLYLAAAHSPGLEEIGARLTGIFPESFTLRAHHAKLALARGDADGPQKCRELSNTFSLFTRNQAFFKEYTEGYWSSFAAGHEAIQRGTLGWD